MVFLYFQKCKILVDRKTILSVFLLFSLLIPSGLVQVLSEQMSVPIGHVGAWNVKIIEFRFCRVRWRENNYCSLGIELHNHEKRRVSDIQVKVGYQVLGDTKIWWLGDNRTDAGGYPSNLRARGLDANETELYSWYMPPRIPSDTQFDSLTLVVEVNGTKTDSTTIYPRQYEGPWRPAVRGISSNVNGGEYTIITQGQSVMVSGMLAPARTPEAVSGKNVTLIYNRPSGSSFVKTVSTNSSGFYSDTYTSDSSGKWSVTAEYHYHAVELNEEGIPYKGIQGVRRSTAFFTVNSVGSLPWMQWWFWPIIGVAAITTIIVVGGFLARRKGRLVEKMERKLLITAVVVGIIGLLVGLIVGVVFGLASTLPQITELKDENTWLKDKKVRNRQVSLPTFAMKSSSYALGFLNRRVIFVFSKGTLL